MLPKYSFTVVIEKDADGYYAYCPQLQGCYAQGKTYEEVLANIEDVIRLHLDDHKASKEEWRKPDLVNVTSLEFAL